MNTKWEEQFDNEFGGLKYDSTDKPIKSFINSLIEEIIENIPNDKYFADITTGDDPIPTNELKDQLRKKYIN